MCVDAEGTSLLDVLTSRIKPSHRVAGDIWLNGNQIPLQRLGTRVGYVRRDYRLHPDITVLQTMQFHGMQLDMGRSEKRKRVGYFTDFVSPIYYEPRISKSKGLF